jgi:hypothetical protein
MAGFLNMLGYHDKQKTKERELQRVKEECHLLLHELIADKHRDENACQKQRNLYYGSEPV